MVYAYPETDDTDWGPEATDWAAAVTTGMLQKTGGLFQLLAEVDFGTAFGVKALSYKTRTTNVADAGQFRLARADVINWRNQANAGNLSLGVSASDILQFNGVDIQTALSVSDTATIDLTLSSNTLSADIVAGSITNAMISASAAIAFSKLATLTSGNLLVGSAGNVATSVAMSGDATIIASGALTIANDAVSNAKLAEMATLTIKGNATGGTANPTDLSVTAVTAMLNAFVGDSGAGGTKGLVPAPAAGDTAAGKFLKADGVWTVPAGGGDVVGPASATDNGFARFDGTTGKILKDSAATIVNADVDAAAAIAYSKLDLAGDIVNADINAAAAIAYSKLNLGTSIVNADIAAAAAIAFSKLATLTSANILVGSAGNVATAVAVTGDISLTNGGVTAYAGTVPLNKGGTGQTTKAPAFDALSPMTTGGDLIYGGASGTGTRLANGTAGQFLRSSGTTVAPTWSDLPTAVSFAAYESTTATSPTTPIIYTTEDHDTDGAYNTATGVFTVPAGKGGVYFFRASAYFGATATSPGLYKNGAQVTQGTQATSVSVASLTYIISAAAGDTFDIRTGGSATAQTGATLNSFGGYRIHP